MSPRLFASTSGLRLYARSRTVPRTLVLLTVTCVFAGWAAHRTGDAELDPGRATPVATLAALAAAALIGASLYAPSHELDRTAVRPWWPRRLAHLLALTAVAALMAALLPLAPAAALRDLLGCVGLTATAAVLFGARLSWLPASCYVGAMCLASGGVHGWAVTVWAWPAAGAAFALGAALYAVQGARPEDSRD
ncbi:hypothetical protein SAMN04487983_102329 [Streptomyces sp. yr375]|uniref:hypothetical protein n=1 Tax=Streptomyces sp. yr375 TaxID=1761906 RepID=UPI0008C39C46|nr:hypothetical protein [Streptomyces sp. yr375]SER82990.1 hypothetical protein SAMN04487983_102329 [Streptomyces sp. yr375]